MLGPKTERERERDCIDGERPTVTIVTSLCRASLKSKANYYHNPFVSNNSSMNVVDYPILIVKLNETTLSPLKLKNSPFNPIKTYGSNTRSINYRPLF